MAYNWAPSSSSQPFSISIISKMRELPVSIKYVAHPSPSVSFISTFCSTYFQISAKEIQVLAEALD
jgi:hypothetical protein